MTARRSTRIGPALAGGSVLLLCLLLPPPDLRAQPEEDCSPDTDAALARSLNCIRLVPTKHAPDAGGVIRLRFPDSPYGLTVTEDGRFVYDLDLQVRGLRAEPGRVHVAWVTTPDLKQRRPLGVIGGDGHLVGQVDWNKFLVLVTSEASPEAGSWEGPILLTAISPSGRLQSMAGEEIFGNNELPVGTRYCLVNRC